MGLPLYPKGGWSGNKVPPVPFPSTKGQSEIDLREEMKLLINGDGSSPRRGHWVILRRMDKRQRCSCWNEVGHGEERYSLDNSKYNEPKLRCKICNGEGWIYQDELHLTRRRYVAPEIGLAGSEQTSDIGITNVSYMVYYFQHYVNPKKEDKIIEVKLDDLAKPVRPIEMLETYKIAVPEPFRDINGRVEYWRASCELEIT